MLGLRVASLVGLRRGGVPTAHRQRVALLALVGAQVPEGDLVRVRVRVGLGLGLGIGLGLGLGLGLGRG